MGMTEGPNGVNSQRSGKNGRGCYAIIDISEYEQYEKDKAALRLMCELERGRKSGEENGWISADEVRARFEERLNG